MKTGYLATAVMLMLTPASAFAADAVRAEVVRADGYVRLNFVWPEGAAEAELSADASVGNQVLLVRFSRDVAMDVGPILNGAGTEVALAKMDPDQRTLRVALRVPARAHVSRSYNMLAVDLLPPEAADPPDVVSPRAAAEAEARARAAQAAAEAANAPPPPAAPLERLEVRRASSPAFDRIVFAWPLHTDYSLTERDDAWVLTFARDAEPDLGSLRADLPARLRAIEATHADGKLSIRIVPAPGAAPRAFRERNTVMLDLATEDTGDGALLEQLQALADAVNVDGESVAPPQAPAEAAAPPVETEFAAAPEQETAEAAPEPPAPEAQATPVPESGVVAVQATALGADLVMEFPWAAPVKAAAFRRAGAIWIVFDAAAALDVSEIARGQRHVADVQTLQGENYSAVRIAAPETTQISLRAPAAGAQPGASWTFILAEHAETAPAPVRIERRAEEGDAADAPARLFAGLPGAGEPVRIPDPGVGDTLLVAAAPAPARGVLERRDYLSFSVLPSAQGLAIQSLSATLGAHATAEGVWITPPTGMAGDGLTRPAAAGPSPAVIAFVAGESGAVYERGRSEVEKRVAAQDLPAAQIEMARFLLARELAPEALGALALAAERDAQLGADPAFRALRGVAYALAGRQRQAETDLSLPALEPDAAVQLWRAWLRAQNGDWVEARRAFAAGEAAIDDFPAHWRARFREAYARTALELNDLTAAKTQIDRAGAETADAPTALRIAYDSARWREAAGQKEDALASYDGLAQSGDEEIEARAILAGARLKHELGRTGTGELIETLEGLRWRWRGDDVELETIRTLGALYVAGGQDRQGLEAMKAAVARFPDHPVSRTIFTDMMAMFSALFLDGGADRLDPVEALALYFQFSDLTPVGADGDRMIRRLSERLVAFDLLPQAAELLQHQVDQRLHEPRARAEVASNLALIYLMDRQPESALRTLRGTRVTQLPPALAEERKIIEARALAELNADDAALDLIAGDPSVEAARLRADIAWKQRDWSLAGERLEEMLADRWSQPGPINAPDRASVLRAAVAYSLARDRAGLARLSARYGAMMRATADEAAFTAVTQELETSGLRLAEIAERAADVTALESFLAGRRDALETHEEPAAAIEATPAAAVAPQAGADGRASAG